MKASAIAPRRRYPLVERREGIDRESLERDYLARNRPVIVSVVDVASRTHWDLATLRATYGDCAIDAEETEQVYVGQRARRRLPLSALIDGVLAGDVALRCKGLELLSTIDGMKAQLAASPPPSDRLLPTTTASTRRALWVAPKGTMSSFHHDGNSDNYNWQIEGEKLFVLARPDRFDELYAHGSAESPINPFHPDLGRFPRFASAAPLEATLRPGEVLLVPKYWWHCVYTAQPSVNLNTWFSFRGEISPWRALAGAPLLQRSCAALAAEMKRRELFRLASATRRLWYAAYERLADHPRPEPRGELLDP